MQSKEELSDSSVWSIIRATLGFFGVDEVSVHSMLSYVLPQNLTPVYT